MGPLARALRLSLASALAFVAPLLTSTVARAGGMDPTPERLVNQPPIAGGCLAVAMNPTLANPLKQYANHFSCSPDNVAFKNLASELGFAIAPTAFHPAHTTGFGGFVLSLEASFTHLNVHDMSPSDASYNGRTDYWNYGTRGSDNSVRNNSPNSLLGIYSLKARKGIAFGFEIAGDIGYIANTSLVVGGADVRWALLEGFRTGFLGYVPDVAVGGGVRTMTGSSKLYLTTVGIDAQISKPFTLADQAVLTPYLGYQHLIIFGNSAVLDATPTVDAQQACGYLGRDQTGQPVCSNKYTAYNGSQQPNDGDFNNNVTFNSVTLQRDRMIVGVNYRLEILYLAGQMAFDITDPSSTDSDLTGSRQWTMSLEAGVFF
jgi:hypothetical protein